MSTHDNAGVFTRFLSRRELRDITGLSDPTLWRLRRAGVLPEPVRLSPGRVAWRADVIEQWIETRESR
jgi:prophage regulatory protein